MTKGSRFFATLCMAETALLLCLSLLCAHYGQIPPADDSGYLEPREPVEWAEEKKTFWENPFYREREALFMSFQTGDVDLVCLGDSITQKFEWQDAFPNWRVANRGIGSDTTAGITARLDSVKALHPAVISLMAGINDLGGSSPEGTAVSYAALLDALSKNLPGTTVVVSSLLPVSAEHPIDNQNVQVLNTSLQALCQERGLVFLDMYEAFAGEDGCLRPEYALDNIHLSAEGYRVWLSYLVPALEAAVSS